jgi:adenylosuccinate lyase
MPLALRPHFGALAGGLEHALALATLAHAVHPAGSSLAAAAEPESWGRPSNDFDQFSRLVTLLQNVVRGLEVHPARIRRRVDDELPFMATEELIVRFVRAGGDRQEAHEIIRGHSIAAARAVKDGAARNDMLERLAADPAFGVPLEDLQAVAEPARFVGRAPQQVEEFLEEHVAPWLSCERASVDQEEVRV